MNPNTTPDEQKISEKEDAARFDDERRKEYYLLEEGYTRRIQALPEPFSARLVAFRDRNPRSWRWRYEAYELFVCEQAVVIADALKDPAAVSTFRRLSNTEQYRLVPGVSQDHSQNTFEVACMMARIYLTKPRDLLLCHGALCNLVGCHEYGCPV
jgi:hypothetical protein